MRGVSGSKVESMGTGARGYAYVSAVGNCRRNCAASVGQQRQ